MTDSPYADIFSRVKARGPDSVTVYDRPREESGARIIGTAGGSNGRAVAHHVHYSLADRSEAEVPGPHETIGDAVRALIASYDREGGETQ